MDQRESMKGVSKEDEQVTDLSFMFPGTYGRGGEEKKHVGTMNDLNARVTSAQLLN